MLASRLGEQSRRLLFLLVQRAGIVVVPFDAGHWQLAIESSLRYGRGRHPAELNFGDCLAYATARLAGRPLLCKGDGFRRTDLTVA